MSEKLWYALHIGRYDTDDGTGSFDYDVVRKMAEEAAKEYPNEYVEIVTVDPEDDFCLGKEVIQHEQNK